MAFDFGLKNIGIAIGQEITRTASTFYSLKATEGKPKWAELDRIIIDWKPGLFVVGDPLIWMEQGVRYKIYQIDSQIPLIKDMI